MKARDIEDTGQKSAPAPMDIVIGLDFGTRWTKVAYKLEVVPDPVIVKGPGAEPNPFFASRIFLDPSKNTVSTQAGANRIPVNYLKLFLFDSEQPVLMVPENIRSILGSRSIDAVCAFYLASVLKRAMADIGKAEAARLGSQLPRWSLNISIPAAHMDAERHERFQTVGAVALSWAVSGEIASETGIDELVSSFDHDARQLSEQPRHEVGVFAEIIAALNTFLSRRDTPVGLHGFIDIGAGTLDGCIFRLRRPPRANPEIDILAAAVARLGSIMVSYKSVWALANDVSNRIEPNLLGSKEEPSSIPLPLDEAAKAVRGFVGGLGTDCVGRFPGRIMRHDQHDDSTRKGAGEGFVFQLTGGGAGSAWYQGRLNEVHAKNKLDNWGVMPFAAKTLAAPAGYDGASFPRCIVALGLTQDRFNLQRLVTRLPAQVPDAAALPMRTPQFDYSDTKDFT